MKSTVSPQETVAFLNSLLKIDRGAITKLVTHRVGCCRELADHPTVQVRSLGGPRGSDFTDVGLLGILNGLFGATGPQYIGIVVDDDNVIVCFEVLDLGSK